MLKQSLVGLIVLGLVIQPNQVSANFKDVGTTHQYQEAINRLAKDGCIKGYEDGTFKPDNNINRAETLKLILQCFDIPKIYSEEKFNVPAGSSYVLNGEEVQIQKDSEFKIKVPFNPETYPNLEFRDVNNTEWFTGVLKEALVRKIITGYSDNTIKPTKTVSKGEFFTMLYRIVPTELQKVDLTVDLAKDALKGQWFSEGLGFAMQNQLISVDAEGNLNPFRELNRGQVAHFIHLYKNWLTAKQNGSAPTAANNSTSETQAVTWAIGNTEKGIASYYAGNLNGAKTSSGDLYNQELLTAAHKTIPFKSKVKVTNLDNGKWVEVIINDRGPYVEGRILDLSEAAFKGLLNENQTKEQVGILKNIQLEVIAI